MTTPPQRPVLQRAADADLSPAAPPGALAAARGHAEDSSGSKGSKGSKKAKGSKKKSKKKHASGQVTVEFELSEKQVQRLDERAAQLGHSRTRTLELLVQAWLDG